MQINNGENHEQLMKKKNMKKYNSLLHYDMETLRIKLKEA